MEIAVILTVVLPVIYGEYQEMQLIRQLTNYYHFDHHLFLLHSAIDPNRFISSDGLTPQTVYVWNETENAIDIELKSKNCLFIVASERTEFIRHPLNVIKAMQKHQKLVKVGIFYTQKSSVEDLLNLFEWCRNLQMTDTFAATYLRHYSEQCTSHECLLNIFTFHPFGSISELVNVTGSDRFDDYFPSKNANFYGRTLRYGGAITADVHGILWQVVFDLMNASFVEVEFNIHRTSPKKALEDGLDVLRSAYAPENHHDLDVYPVSLNKYTVLVPKSLPYSDLSSYLKNGISGEFFIYAITSIVASTAVLIVLRYIQRKRILILQSAADVFSLLLNDNGRIKYQQLFRAEVFVIVPLTFVGFILVNGILSSLKSHLTRPVFQPQLRTPEDIYNNKVPIVVHSEQWKRLILEQLSNRTKYGDWNQQIVVDENEVINYLQLYNRTNAFLLPPSTVDILLRVQKVLHMNGYHRSDIDTPAKLFSYRVHRRFLLFERLNDIMLLLKSAGLINLWWRREITTLEGNVLKENLVRLQHQGAESMGRFEFPMLIVYGWVAGFVVLIFEVMWNKIKGK